jgi:hypothetical protein
MASFVVKNNAESLVADNPLAQAAVTLNVTNGEGTNFPSTFPFLITLWDETTYPDPTDDSGMEIVKCTARTTDALTIVRAQEGTGDVAHALGERVAMLITAGILNDATYGISTKIDTVETNADVTDAVNIASSIVGVVDKATPVNADSFGIIDSAAANVLKELTWTNVKSTLKTYFDTLYNNYTHPNHTGPVTSTGDGATAITNDAVTYAKIQNVTGTDKILGRSTAGAGIVEEIACTAAGRAILDDADAAAQRTTLGAIASIVEDTTPQLGGTLDSNSKQIRWSKGSDVASGTALTLGADGNYFDITGTTTITSISALAVGTVVMLHFDGILWIAHHAADLILPGAANILTAAGDEVVFVEYATGDWRCISYTKASGVAVVVGDYKPGGADVAIADGGTGASTAADGFAALKQAATSSATGVVELSITSEINTGTSTLLANTPDALAGSIFGTKQVVVKVIADDTTLTVADGLTHFTVPIELNGMNLVSVGAHIYTVSSSGLPNFQIHNLTDAVDMLSTAITIDATENDSKDATTPPVINTATDDVATGDVIRFDCDGVGTGTKGMEIRMGFRLP